MEHDESTTDTDAPAVDLTYKGYAAKIDDVRGDDTLVVRISTDDVDRDGEVVTPDGMNVDDYQKNPVVLWHHDYGPESLPIGRNLWLKPNAKRKATSIIAATQFDMRQEFARDVFRLYKDGYMSAWSIGANDVQRRKLTPDEIKANPKWAAAESIWDSWKLMEYSAVKMPANPNTETMRGAGTLAYSAIKGLVSPETIARLGVKPEETPKPQPPAPPAVQRITVVTRAPRVVLAPPQVRRRQKTVAEIVKEEIARIMGAV